MRGDRNSGATTGQGEAEGVDRGRRHPQSAKREPRSARQSNDFNRPQEGTRHRGMARARQPKRLPSPRQPVFFFFACFSFICLPERREEEEEEEVKARGCTTLPRACERLYTCARAPRFQSTLNYSHRHAGGRIRKQGHGDKSLWAGPTQRTRHYVSSGISTTERKAPNPGSSNRGDKGVT